jgi:hypothetical protein
MVGQAVGTTGESSKDDRQDVGPTENARRHQILLLFAITFENPYKMETSVSEALIGELANLASSLNQVRSERYPMKANR